MSKEEGCLYCQLTEFLEPRRQNIWVRRQLETRRNCCSV